MASVVMKIGMLTSLALGRELQAATDTELAFLDFI